MITGHCECKSVSFEADSDITDFSHCHCSQCRRLHGAAFATYAGVERAKFHYLSGEANLTVYASSENHNRIFCKICGSNIMVELSDYPDELYLSMSAIDGNPPRPTGYHIYVGSKAPWFEIGDKLKQYHEGVPD
jgi:hypothetical protein